jgi:hypothetical protein
MRNPGGAKPELVKRANPPVEMIPKRNEVTVEQVVEILNQALDADDVALTDLIQTRVACNEKLAKHSSIQVGLAPGCDPEDKKLFYEVGILGLLNGLFGVDEKQWGAIAAEIDKTGRVNRFVVREPWTGVFTEVDS